MFLQADEIGSWFSSSWFHPSVLKNFQWESPYYLYWILFIPLLFLLRWLLILIFKSRQKLDVALFEEHIKWSWASLLRFIPDVIFAFILTLILIALARPQKINEQVEQWTEGIDIMLVLDASGSMDLKDFSPNRLEAAKEVARKFIAGRFQDRIGIVVFAGDAYSLAPLTTDYQLLYSLIDDINLKMIENDGTSIGSALGVAINRMRESNTKSKVLILLSDGDNTAGNIDPITAAELAHAYNIKIYTIGMGKDGKIPYGKDFFGRTRYIESNLDEGNLRKIAEIGEGKFFRATNKNALQNVFNYIDEYEKAEIKETRFKDTKDFYQVYLKWAIVLFLCWMVLKSTFINNAMED